MYSNSFVGSIFLSVTCSGNPVGNMQTLQNHLNFMSCFCIVPLQTDSVQYSNCNASDGSGMFHYNGFCLAGDTIMLMLTENSQNLENTVNFENNSLYYFTSKYFIATRFGVGMTQVTQAY